MIQIKIAFLIWLASLNFLRGYHWRPLGIALMSISMGLWVAIALKTWWLLFACGVPMGVCLGLGDHNRGVWCSLVALGASFALLITGHLFWLWFVLYCGGNYLLGWVCCNKLKLPQPIIDPITGAGFGVIVFLI